SLHSKNLYSSHPYINENFFFSKYTLSKNNLFLYNKEKQLSEKNNKKEGMVIKKKLKNFLVSLLFITLLIYLYNLHQEKRMYEEYISIDIYNDMSTLVVSIIENDKLYGNILEEEVITRGDAD